MKLYDKIKNKSVKTIKIKLIPTLLILFLILYTIFTIGYVVELL